MAVQGFLKVPDIPGESTSKDHEDEIDVVALSFGMGVPASSATEPRSGRVQLQPLMVTKHYDRSSPYLKRALFDNVVFPEVVLTVSQALSWGRGRPGDRGDYLVVTLTGASVMSYDLVPAEGLDQLEERLAFGYRSITFTYHGEHETVLDPSQNT
ncbi:Hcp family type VI secretion system effector [Ornithinimicrobium sediminis]|uniref:Hcp family type VI secretion system effector n=1 Tax=Ornithinimicrobium sediminis TaxID=2904603 RepID=UPI001E5D15D6|nr:type VI secretion system tube protein Hcp [Ornithinimicrobium sediminis]MCE0487057.1 type VI secretion system tube protein Hcp [Ornithinimicrobium sediminis]